ncbi:hypothetical protein E0504_38990 [Parafrankia sp. BMG5.11]|nr:hypothetical protein E0504_38990 [Parafrankia sp. BMG5.11]
MTGSAHTSTRRTPDRRRSRRSRPAQPPPRAHAPDVLAAERKERARIRSEKGIRWGGRPLKTAA